MLKPNTWALTGLLAALTALGPLSTDMYLAALPQIMRDTGATNEATQLTLSVFLIGFAFGQIFYGPMADRIGRRPVLLGGVALYMISSLGCAFAQTIDLLIVARFFQALGAAAPIVLARAVVRDLYEGQRAGQELARMGSIMGLVPAIAPFFGGVIAASAGWRAVFFVCVGFGVFLLFSIGKGLPETLRQRETSPFSLVAIFRNFADLLKNRNFRGFLALIALTYGGLFAFISGSSFVLQDVYGQTPILFGVSFGVCAGAYVVGTLIGQRTGPRRGAEFTIGLGVSCLALGGVLMVVGVLSALAHPLAVVAPMMIYMVGVGLTLPQAQAGALMPFPGMAGTASSLCGVVQMSFAAIIGVAVSTTLGEDGLPLSLFVAFIGLAALGVFYAMTRSREV